MCISSKGSFFSLKLVQLLGIISYCYRLDLALRKYFCFHDLCCPHCLAYLAHVVAA